MVTSGDHLRRGDRITGEPPVPAMGPDGPAAGSDQSHWPLGWKLMFPLLALLFLIVPIVELYVIVQVAQGVGVAQTIGLLIVVSMVGAWLVKAQGLFVLRRIQEQLLGGSMPGKELVDGGLILFAGALMLTPGFVTDALGVVLLLPPTRAVARSILMRRFKGRVQVFGAAGGPAAGFGFAGSYMDVDVREVDHVDLTRNDTPGDTPPSLDA